MKIEITKEEINALATFLQRVDLKGAEVPAYNRIISILNKPISEIIEEDKE